MTNHRSAPLVTVGVPVYNGERFLESSIRSLLAQTLGDFELLIADNASSDGTAALCQRLSEADSRIRVIRHAQNIGAPRNWNCLVQHARGRYFKWATANDLCTPFMLERCVQTLEEDAGVVLCYGHTQLIAENGDFKEQYAGDLGFEMPRPSDRFNAVCRHLHLNNAMCGVVRTDVLRGTGLDRMYPSGDMALISELSLYGRIRLLPDVLLHRRQSPGTFTSMLSPLQIQRVYDPNAVKPMRMLFGRRHLDNFNCIARAPISWREKARASFLALRLLVSDREHLWQEFRSLGRSATSS